MADRNEKSLTYGEAKEAARALSLVEFGTRWGAAFLIPLAELVEPSGPFRTQSISRDIDETAKTEPYSDDTLVFPLRQKVTSSYSFISIGRTSNCDVTIADQSVSKLHAMVREENGVFTIEDAKSVNGTLVDEVPVPRRGTGQSAHLFVAARVAIGNVQLDFFPLTAFYALCRSVSS